MCAFTTSAAQTLLALVPPSAANRPTWLSRCVFRLSISLNQIPRFSSPSHRIRVSVLAFITPLHIAFHREHGIVLRMKGFAAQVRKLAPAHLRQSRRSTHVTCATFSASGEVLATYNDEVQLLPHCTQPQHVLWPCYTLPQHVVWPCCTLAMMHQ